MSRIDNIIPVSIALPQCDVLIKPASQELNLVSKSQNETEMNMELLQETAPKKKIHKLEDDQGIYNTGKFKNGSLNLDR